MSDNNDLLARIEKLEAQMAALTKPCVYEARPWTGDHPYFTPNPGVMGAYCQTHGWNCPNVHRPQA